MTTETSDYRCDRCGGTRRDVFGQRETIGRCGELLAISTLRDKVWCSGIFRRIATPKPAAAPDPVDAFTKSLVAAREARAETEAKRQERR